MGAFFDWLLSNLNWMNALSQSPCGCDPVFNRSPQADERACQQKSSNFFSATKTSHRPVYCSSLTGACSVVKSSA